MPSLSTVSWITLMLVMACAVWQDLAWRRIPNRLVLPVAGLAMALATWPSGIGLASALTGGLMSGAMFAPLYLMRQMGGGDLKLISTAGLLVGMSRVPALCLSIAMAGGLMAVYWLWRTQRQSQSQAGVYRRMPYAVAIALGSAGHGQLIPLLTI
jgi:prepilin peptidase CpaA